MVGGARDLQSGDENDYEVIFEYSVTDRLTIDTMSGNESSALDFAWRVPIGRKKKKEKGDSWENTSGRKEKD